MRPAAAWRRFAATTRVRTLEFLRDRSALSWNLFFPIMLVAGFAMIFSGPPQPLFTVGLIGAAEGQAEAFLATPGVRVETVADRDTAVRRVARQRACRKRGFSCARRWFAMSMRMPRWPARRSSARF